MRSNNVLEVSVHLSSNSFKSIISFGYISIANYSRKLRTHRYSGTNACQVANNKHVTNYSKYVSGLAKNCFTGLFDCRLAAYNSRREQHSSRLALYNPCIVGDQLVIR